MTLEMLSGLLRHLLTFGGGFLIAKGWFDEATVNSIVAALITLVGAGWSLCAKRKV